MSLLVFAVVISAALLHASWNAIDTYYQYPSDHWRQICTNNPLERIIREILRRTRVVGSMDALLNPAKQEAAA